MDLAGPVLFRLRIDGRGDRLSDFSGPLWQPVVRLNRLEDMVILAGRTSPAGPSSPSGCAGHPGPTGPTSPTDLTGPADPAGPAGPAGPAAEINEHANQHMEEDPLPGGSRRRPGEEDDDEEKESSIKRLKREMEEFGYSDSDSYCSDADDEDIDEDAGADMEVNHHVKEDDPLPGGSRKRGRDVDEEDERSSKRFRGWLADSESDRDFNAPPTSRI